MNKVLFSSKKDDWETPDWLYKKLDQEFKFNLDPCSNDKNYKCENHFTKENNGLSLDWTGYNVFMNPPYGRNIIKWIEKAYFSNTLVVCLLPARTDTKWFHEYCLKGEVHFLKGRLKFVGAEYPAPFPSMIVIFRGKNG